MDEIVTLKVEAHDKSMLLAEMQKKYQEEAKAYNAIIVKIQELEAKNEA